MQTQSPSFKAKFLYSDSLKQVADYAAERGKFGKLNEARKNIDKAAAEGEALGLNADEIAFYDALASHDTAKDVLGDEKLRAIAHELTKAIKKNMSVDWHNRESAKA